MTGAEIVNRISSVLADRGIPKTTFYRECGITSGAISQWKTGKTTPSRKALEKICAYLNCTVRDLTDDDYYGILVLDATPHISSLMKIIRNSENESLGEEQKKPVPNERDELIDALSNLREEERALLQVARGMTAEDVAAVTAFIKQLKGNNDSD